MRGLAILVTCDYRGRGLQLPAANIDAKEMRKTFEKLGYDIHERRNKNATKYEIETLLEDIQNYLEHYRGNAKNQDGSEKVVAFAFSGHGHMED